MWGRKFTELECGREELKLEREEMAKMVQTFEEPTFKDSPMTCMREIIATMQKMAITQDKVNKNLVETIVGIVRSSLEKPHWKAMEAPKARKTFMSKHFSRKKSKLKRVKEWFALLEAYFKAHAITLDNEKV